MTENERAILLSMQCAYVALVDTLISAGARDRKELLRRLILIMESPNAEARATVMLNGLVQALTVPEKTELTVIKGVRTTAAEEVESTGGRPVGGAP